MPLIKVLPVELRNKIAAGEVIERPASVVKELIENSIDAKSSEIGIEILNGGKGLIRVIDNGVGMDREDALLSLERHATSKVSREEDLFNIITMGFRGEALPSIASVSKMRIFTGPRGAYSGTLIEIWGGEIKEIRDYPVIGTIVEVRDLFYNTPARKKFLRAESTESIHIIENVTLEALAYWEIGFKLTMDHREVMNLPPASSERERIWQIYGAEFLDGLVEIVSEREGIRMTSYVSRDGNLRNRRSHQFIFINKRPVRDPTISHAVYQSYEGLPRDRHPLFFLYLSIDPREVDVNVHPTKREVRFSDKERVYRFVRDSIKDFFFRAKKEEVWTIRDDINTLEAPIMTEDSLAIREEGPVFASENEEFRFRQAIPFIHLGDAFVAYASKEGLVLLDFHAAHERVLYESFLRGKDIGSVRLLFPRQVRLSAKEYRIVLDNAEILNEMGIEVDDFGYDTVLVRSLPIALKKADLPSLLSEIAVAIVNNERPEKPLKEIVAAKMACHKSVRGGEILTNEEVQSLIQDLDKTKDPDHCPHGRPIRRFLSINDLRRMFGRPTK